MDSEAVLFFQSGMPQEEYCFYETLASGNRGTKLQEEEKESVDAVSLIDQIQDASSLCGILESVGVKNIPLYQRVLSALIAEDEIEEFEEDSAGRNMPFQYYNITPHVGGGAYHLNGVEPTDSNGFGYDYGSPLGTQTPKDHALDRYACNGNNPFMRVTDTQNDSYKNDYFKRQHGMISAEIGMLPEILDNCVDGQSNTAGSPVQSCLYEKMWLEERLLLELQSIGLFPEKVVSLISTSLLFNKSSRTALLNKVFSALSLMHNISLNCFSGNNLLWTIL